MSSIVLVSDASNGFGRLTAEALAVSGHTVYAALKEIKGRHAVEARKMAAFSQKHDVDLRVIELDMLSQASVDKAVAKIVAATGRIDVLIQSSAAMASPTAGGSDGALTPRRLATLYDIHVLAARRMNRAVLPHMRSQRQGLMIWISKSGMADDLMAEVLPGFTTRAGMDDAATLHAKKLSLWGVETSIIIPEAPARTVHQFAHPSRPAGEWRIARHEAGAFAGFGGQMQNTFSPAAPFHADSLSVADTIVDIVDMPSGKRPFQIHLDPAEDAIHVDVTLPARLHGDLSRPVQSRGRFRARLLS